MIKKLLITGLLLIGICLIHHSCKVVKGFSAMNQEKVKINTFTNGTKEVKFLNNHHVGKQLYYGLIEDIVIKYKAEGYVVFFEAISITELTDSIAIDTEKRKMRKMIGFDAGPKGYGAILEELDTLGVSVISRYVSKLMVQPPYKNMGVDSTDINADVTRTEMINAYETLYGNIVLEDVDIKTPLGNEYNMKKAVKNDLDPIILDYRNQELANKIMSSKQDKILVFYGEGHKKGFFNALKKMDKNWKRKGRTVKK